MINKNKINKGFTYVPLSRERRAEKKKKEKKAVLQR